MEKIELAVVLTTDHGMPLILGKLDDPPALADVVGKVYRQAKNRSSNAGVLASRGYSAQAKIFKHLLRELNGHI